MNKDARYLIRLSHSGAYRPAEQAALLKKVRDLVVPLGGKAINLRVSPTAIEFDLFIDPQEEAGTFAAALKPIGQMLTSKRLDVPPPPIDPAAVVSEARALFNEHRFWEVHEVLEGLWKELKGSEKELVQGLIIASAALVHVQKEEWTPVWTMLADAMKRLRAQPETYYGWNITQFRNHFTQALAKKNIEIPTV